MSPSQLSEKIHQSIESHFFPLFHAPRKQANAAPIFTAEHQVAADVISALGRHDHPHPDGGTRFGSVCRQAGHRGMSKYVDPGYFDTDSSESDSAQVVSWPLPKKKDSKLLVEAGGRKWRQMLLALPEVLRTCNHFSWIAECQGGTSVQIACHTRPLGTVWHWGTRMTPLKKTCSPLREHFSPRG